MSGEHGHPEYATGAQVNDLNSLVAANIANLTILEGRITDLETVEPPPPPPPPDPDPVPDPDPEPPPPTLSLTFNGQTLTELQPNTPYNIQLQGYDNGTGPVIFTDNHGNTNTENFFPWDKTTSTYPPGPLTITVTSPDFTEAFTLQVTNTTTPTPTTTTYYGNPIAASGLANTVINGPYNTIRQSTPFRPPKTGTLIGIKRYWRWDNDNANPFTSGYARGTGGTMRSQIEGDNGNGLPDNTIINSTAYADFKVTRPSTSRAQFTYHTFKAPTTVTGGTLYHLVTHNIDPNPTTNYISTNALTHKLYQSTKPPIPTTILPKPEFRVLRYRSGQWEERVSRTDVVEFHYDDGTVYGQGYIHAPPENWEPISGTRQVRQQFTPDTDITINQWHLSVGFPANTTAGDLTGTLTDNAGNTLASASVHSSAVQPVTATGGGHYQSEHAYWADFPQINPVTLTAGHTYHITFTAPSSTEFRLHAARAGDMQYQFSNQTVWDNSRAQVSADGGGSWLNWWTQKPTRRDGDHDLSVYFTTTTNNPPPPPSGPEPTPTPDVDLILTPGEPINLAGATDVRIGWAPDTVIGRINLEGAKRIQFLGTTPLTVDGTLDAGGPLQTGTVNAWRSEDVELTNVDVINSPRSAFSIEHATRLTIDRSSAINAWHLGVHGGYLQDVTVRRSLFENNSRRIPTAPGDQSEGWESGDLKLTNAHNTVVEDNTCRLGYGPGIWFDIHNTGTRIRRNRVFDKHAEGIFYEISHGDAIIEDNEIRNSPTGLNSNRMNWLYGAGILISTSSGVQVLRNTVDGSYHGIIVIDQSHRGDTPNGYNAADYLIDHNTVRNVNKVGAGQDVGRLDVFNPAGWGPNNTYQNVQRFEWQGEGYPF